MDYGMLGPACLFLPIFTPFLSQEVLYLYVDHTCGTPVLPEKELGTIWQGSLGRKGSGHITWLDGLWC